MNEYYCIQCKRTIVIPRQRLKLSDGIHYKYDEGLFHYYEEGETAIYYTCGPVQVRKILITMDLRDED